MKKAILERLEKFEELENGSKYSVAKILLQLMENKVLETSTDFQYKSISSGDCFSDAFSFDVSEIKRFVASECEEAVIELLEMCRYWKKVVEFYSSEYKFRTGVNLFVTERLSKFINEAEDV
jgi:hypothetical protein